MLKKCLIAASLTAMCAWAAPASALTFCPNGTPVGCVTFEVMDQAPGNAIADAFFGTPVSPGPGSNFNVFYQANLGSMQLADTTGTFLNGTGGNFFTYVLGFQERLVSSTVIGGTGILTFDYSPLNDAAINNSPTDPNFFYMYKVPAIGNNLLGTGFVPAAPGVAPNPILSGHSIPLGYNASFTSTGLTTPDPLECPAATPSCLDQGGVNGLPGNNKDNYPGVQTVGGAGSVNIKIIIDSFNPNYFPDLPVGTVITLDANTSTNLPFEEIDPSAAFSSTGLVGANKVGVGSVGAVNAISGPNTMFQADANSSLVAVSNIPEPATLTLLGLGLMAGVRRRMKK